MFGKSSTRALRKRYIELAAMAKEKAKGTLKDLEQIKNRFALQEGVKSDRVQEYLDIMEGAGLIVFTPGRKRWKYDSSAEWELFKINI